ncbi:MAG: menaquinone-specific isochorismate synthase [Bacteriovoracaceae bacterium]|jgi:isochorismate synthase EntC
MSTQNSINLSELDFFSFLKCGEIIQMPGSKQVWLGCGEIENQIDSNFTTFFQSNFKGDQFSTYTPKFLVKTNVESLSSYLEDNFKDRLRLNALRNGDDLFVEDVKEVVRLINSSKPIEKLVAVTTKDYHSSNQVHPLSRFSKFIELNGSIYGKWRNGKGFLGCSPEPLFTKNHDQWMTKALAGTISTGIHNYDQILLNDEKEILEHELVIKDIVLKLNKFATKICVGETICIEFGSIAHIQTLINFENSKHGPHSLIKALSPTAALGGFPGRHVHEFLSNLNYFKNEKNERQFGGVFGLNSSEECFGLVSIRNIYWDKLGFTIHSGCGVVKDSIPEKELKEVQNKRFIIERIFS